MVFCLVEYRRRFFKVGYVGKETLAGIIADGENPKAIITIYSANKPGFILDGSEKEVAIGNLDVESIMEMAGDGR